jgi:SAM-dependent methyltransferase
MSSDEQPRSPDAVIDVSRLMEEVKERVAHKRARGIYGGEDEDLLGDGPGILDLQFEAPIDRLRASALIAGRRETLFSHRRFIGPAMTFVRRAAVKAISPILVDIVAQLNAFHLELVSYLREIEEHRSRLDRVEELSRGVAARLNVAPLHPELITMDSAGRPAIGFQDGQDPAGVDLYRRFEDVFHESEDFVREKQRPHLALLGGRSPVLDVGCGRGEFLDLLAEAGTPARGIDSDLGMIKRCQAKGHDVELAEATEYLEAQPDDSLGVVFSAQVIEHLAYDDLQRFLSLVRKKLVPAGVFLAETVNPHSVFAFRYFWLDLTHRAPIYPEVATLLCLLHGFASAVVSFPSGSSDLDENRRTCQDYVLVATK